MGGLRPIGSEKLEGMDKIRRIMEIARYNESIPQPVNEDKKTEYTAELADGKTYTIVRERLGYIIKESYDNKLKKLFKKNLRILKLQDCIKIFPRN